MNLRPFYSIVKAAFPSEKIFMYEMPDKHGRAILLKVGAGGAAWDKDIPKYRKARLQAVIRETEFQRGYALAELVAASLNKGRLISESVCILRVNPLHDPIPYRRSEGGYIEFSVNFETVYIEG